MKTQLRVDDWGERGKVREGGGRSGACLLSFRCVFVSVLRTLCAICYHCHCVLDLWLCCRVCLTAGISGAVIQVVEFYLFFILSCSVYQVSDTQCTS